MNIQAMKERISVRNFSEEAIEKDELQKLKVFIDQINDEAGLFGNKIRMQYIENTGDDVKLGTYGVIKGANYFIGAACPKSDKNLEDLGYLLERVILYATTLGLGTIWLGGTFGRSAFSKAMNLQPDEMLPIVSPVGYEGGKKSLFGRLIKSNAGNRKPWSELFFDGNFETPLKETDPLKDVLEMVRIAPSAVNFQPWRILKEGNQYHVYSAGKMEMNRIDMGIALCHLELAAKELKLSGKFRQLQKSDEGKLKYLISWITE